MNYIFLDIETVPLEIKDDSVKMYFMDNKITKENRAFNPVYSKVVCICVKKKNEESIVFSGEEREILEKFINYLSENKESVFVTYNGYGFDIPFLKVRTALNKMKFPFEINSNKFRMENSNHFDVMLFLSQGIFTNTRLDVVARMNGVEIPSERIIGKEVERLYFEGNIERIKEHCKKDLDILEKLFDKIVF